MSRFFIVEKDEAGNVVWQKEIDATIDHEKVAGEIKSIQKLGEEDFEVLSSKKDRWYKVSTNGAGTCDCPAFKFRGGQGCKHLEQVRSGEQKNTQPKRQNALRFIENNSGIDAVTVDELFGEQLMKRMIVEGEIYEVKGQYRITK